jgi:hypothetical protein
MTKMDFRKADELHDEIASLTAERDQWEKLAVDFKLTIDRLRAALEKALGALPGSADWHVARRELERGEMSDPWTAEKEAAMAYVVAERDRLQDHNRRLQKWIDDVNEPEFEAVKAERDRLVIIADAIQTERDRLQSLLDTYDTALSRECKKLRAELENIYLCTSLKQCVDVARRALEGK